MTIKKPLSVKEIIEISKKYDSEVIEINKPNYNLFAKAVLNYLDEL